MNPKFTLNVGLRYEYYPLMTRQDRGIELLDLNTFNVKLGGLGGNPTDLGIKVSNTLFAPRLGAAYRLNENTVLRGGYGKTFTPLPWSRPMRGRFPLTIAFGDAGVNGFTPYGSINNGIPNAPSPDLSTGNVPLPRGVDMTSPNPDDVTRGATQSWNAFIERRLPLDVAVSVGYVGTRTDGQFATRNAQLRGIWRQCQPAAVHSGRYGDHQRLREHCENALPLAPAGGESSLQEWLHDQRGLHAEQVHERG